jgi:predicted amidohydrolase YtcJ
MLSDNAALLDRWFSRGPLLDYGGRLTVRSVKLYADGALGSRGAALLEPYSDDPDNRGLMRTSTDHIREVAIRGRQTGFQVNTHAIGDGAVRSVIDAYEAAGVRPSDRFRIEHLQVMALEDLPRLVRLGIIASMQPTHGTSDMPWAERRVGPERIRGAYAWRTILNAGGIIALGSDFPVEQVNPWHGIHAAVTRKDLSGHPPGGWYPDQRLTIEEALRGFARGAAYAAFEETRRGTIAPGMDADLTITSTDPTSSDPQQLHATKVLYTIVGGKIAHAAKE